MYKYLHVERKKTVNEKYNVYMNASMGSKLSSKVKAKQTWKMFYKCIKSLNILKIIYINNNNLKKVGCICLHA